MKLKAVMDGGKLRTALRAIDAIAETALFRVSSEGISTAAIDPATVAMVSLAVKRSAFDFYECEEGEFAVDVRDLLPMIESDTTTIEIDDAKKRLKIVSGKTTFGLGLIDPSTVKKHPRLPDLSFPGCVALDAGELGRAVKKFLTIMDKQDSIAIDFQEKILSIEGGNQISDLKVEWPMDDIVVRWGEGRAMFSIDYLSTILSALSGKVELSTFTDSPLLISSVGDDISITYVIAPTIQVGD